MCIQTDWLCKIMRDYNFTGHYIEINMGQSITRVDISKKEIKSFYLCFIDKTLLSGFLKYVKQK